MRRGRGARTRFPVVSGKAVPSTGRIPGLWWWRGGGLRTETAVNPTGGPWVLSPMKIHVSPFVCASSAPHRRDHDDWSCSESAAQPPRRKDPPPRMNMLTCSALSDLVAHPIMKDQRSAERRRT